MAEARPTETGLVIWFSNWPIPSKAGGNSRHYAEIFRSFFRRLARANPLAGRLRGHRATAREKSTTCHLLLCRYYSGPGIAEPKGMLINLKRRCTMSPLLLMLLLSLVPFPVLAIAIVAERWMKAPTKSVS